MAEVGIQYCGLALVTLLTYFTYRKKSLGLYSDKSYHLALAAAFICLLSDVVSIHALASINLWPLIVVQFVCRLYISALVFVAFFAYMYIVSDTVNRKVRRWMSIIGGIVVLVGTILIWFLPMYIHATKGELYTYGPAIYATYFFALLYVIVTLIYTLACRQYLSRRRFVSVLTWMIIWLFAGAIQFFNTNLPMVGFATALGLTILFAELENPETYIDRETGVFTAHALMSYMSQKYEEGVVFAGINIVINTDENNLSRKASRTLLVTIANRLELIPDVQIFRNVASEFALVLKDAEAMWEQLPALRALFDEPIPTDDGLIQVQPYYILFPDSSLANNADEVFAYHSFFMPHDPETDYRVIDDVEVKRIRDNLAMRTEISEAIRDRRIEVFYHPIFSVDEQRFTSAEALARIRRVDGSLIMPGAFIPVSESSDQIVHIGEQVFEKVCEFVSKRDIHALGLRYIEVNLSVAQCQRKTLADEFIAIMNRYQVDPKCFNFEITESGSVKHQKTLIANMNTLIKAGSRFSLDDFGTGESNLDYIMNMPVDIIKFDRSFTQAYFNNGRTRYVIDTIIEMIKGLDLDIVSEGVETEEQYDIMMEREIDYIQGYYFAKPMAEEDFLYFLKTH